MGGNINEKNYTIKDDGTITRSRKCPKCGKELFSEGEYCEFCGSKLNLKESTKKKKIWIWILAVLWVISCFLFVKYGLIGMIVCVVLGFALILFLVDTED